MAVALKEDYQRALDEQKKAILYHRRWEEQQTIHKLMSEGDTKPSVWGYELINKQFV